MVESVILEFIENVIGSMREVIDTIDSDFLKGLAVIFFIAFIISLIAGFILLSFWKWQVGVGIIGLIVAIELITAIGKVMR